MDAHNRFETRTTFTLARLEWLTALVVASVLGILHIGEIRWPVFIGFFLVIDVIGYIPGAIAFRRAPGGDISRGYYLAYNIMHSLVTNAILVGLWCLLVGPEWALLAVPIHLFGDRALFGNTLKPFGVPFEPHLSPAFAEFERAYAAEPSTRARSGKVTHAVDA
ncbi:membrane protein [Catellatospora sp. TT07R-123]|uniref:hypothetical protein n=1 Tax=Catellatospora sp. TT07R-123 TaxID=2733863 RepID=UPI001B196821|nr:hypothetical protein [Catellatospora sp. TT07R-123]GHJ43227.1 membrane protein [Catellatospora sp. TT07R-123]